MKRINLLPPEIGKLRRARQVTSAFVLAGIVYVALLGLLWLLGNGRLDAAKQELAGATNRADAVQAQVATLREFANLQTVVARKEQTLATVMADDVHWSRLLVELSMVIPSDAWLTSMSGTATPSAATAPGTPAPAPAAPGSPPKLGTLTFGGVTLDFPGVATWLSRLSNDKSLESVWVSSATKAQIGTRSVVNFNSTGDLSTGAASERYQQPEATP
jgi:Tfp pilus assembly protein PilN